MRYLYACFEGYIGFYTGLQLERLEIDFSKCRHNIVLIVGKNGSGKTTLMSALSLFPDDSSSFVSFLDGNKTLRLINDDNIYDIFITSPCDGKGGRKQSKAFIKKNGIELNENGNITSYKDIIFSEFELDSNYISLSRLSSIDRGLGDKKPAERKRFASAIVDNMEVYNNIYKTLNKKSLILKSTINNLHTKIQNIGSKDLLIMNLNKLTSDKNILANKITELNNQIVSIQAKNSIDEEESKTVTQLSSQLESTKSILDDLNNKLKFYSSKTKIKIEDIENKYNEDLKLLDFYTNKEESLSYNWKTSTDRLHNLEKNIADLEASIEMHESNKNNQNIEKAYTESNKKIKEYESELKELNIPIDINIESLKKYISFCESFISLIDKFYEDFSQKDITLFLDKFIYDNDKKVELLELKSEKEKELEIINEEISNFKAEKGLLDVLNNRPNNCKIDNCSFIYNSLEIKKKYKNISIESLISADLKKKEQISDQITELDQNIAHLDFIYSKKSYFDMIRNTISNYSLEISQFCPEYGDFIDFISNMNNFNNIRDPRIYIDALNIIKLYSEEIKINELYKVKYESFREQISMNNSNKSLLKNMKSEIKDLSKEVSETKQELDKYISLKESITNNISKEAEFYSEYSRYKQLNENYENIQNKLNEYNIKSSKAIEALNSIAGLKQELEKTINEMKPIDDNISRINGQLVLLESYYTEYNENVEMNNTIETVKKYCSPTGGGIQTIFIQMYMRKTLEISNQILSMLFNGQYKLLDFIINDKEFKIPFVGPSGLPADDISSGSMSQVQMMGMVINLALLYQASTKFNIAYLDEIGSGLDNHNQAEFIKVIYYISKYLNMEQVFLICHSLAVDESGVDIIKLADYEEFENSSSGGNIIYDYKNEK